MCAAQMSDHQDPKHFFQCEWKLWCKNNNSTNCDSHCNICQKNNDMNFSAFFPPLWQIKKLDGTHFQTFYRPNNWSINTESNQQTWLIDNENNIKLQP